MKLATLLSIIIFSAASVQAAPLYICKRGGTTEYTAEAKPGCTAIEEEKVASYSRSPTSNSSAYTYSDTALEDEQSRIEREARRAAAEKRLRDAEKALEEAAESK